MGYIQDLDILDRREKKKKQIPYSIHMDEEFFSFICFT